MRCANRLAAGLLLIALSASTARAESGTFGIAAGANAATLSPPAPGSGETLTMRPGVVVGVYAVFPILKSVSFQPELLYVPKYLRRTVNSTDTDLSIKYVELPLLAKMAFIGGTYFTEGVTLGFPIEQFGVAPNLSQIATPDVAVVIGGGYNLRTRAYLVLAKLHF